MNWIFFLNTSQLILGILTASVNLLLCIELIKVSEGKYWGMKKFSSTTVIPHLWDLGWWTSSRCGWWTRPGCRCRTRRTSSSWSRTRRLPHSSRIVFWGSSRREQLSQHWVPADCPPQFDFWIPLGTFRQRISQKPLYITLFIKCLARAGLVSNFKSDTTKAHLYIFLTPNNHKQNCPIVCYFCQLCVLYL